MGVETALMVGGLVASVAGAAVSSYGAVKKGEAEGSAYEAKGQASAYNAAIMRQQAAQELDASKAEASDYARKGSATFASGLASRGATGVTEQGSPLMVDEATVRQIALGVARTRYAGTVRSGRLEEQSQLGDFEATNAKTAAGYAREGGYISGAANLLSGLGSAGTGYATAYGGGRSRTA